MRRWEKGEVTVDRKGECDKRDRARRRRQRGLARTTSQADLYETNDLLTKLEISYRLIPHIATCICISFHTSPNFAFLSLSSFCILLPPIKFPLFFKYFSFSSSFWKLRLSLPRNIYVSYIVTFYNRRRSSRRWNKPTLKSSDDVCVYVYEAHVCVRERGLLLGKVSLASLFRFALPIAKDRFRN